MTAPRLYWLDPAQPDAPFPDPGLALAEPNGLLAVGGDLSPRRLQNAYARGIFPWYDPKEPILWWCPDPRTVFYTDSVHVSRRLARTLARGDYRITLDAAFDDVTAACAAPRADGPGTWLGADMRRAYARLHRAGHAHSIEVWRDHRLIGGLYGVAAGPVFFGESMFSRQRDASKIALVWLARQLAAWGFTLIDGQVGSPHLYRMGAVDLARVEFLRVLRQPAPVAAPNGSWALSPPQVTQRDFR